MTTDQTPTNEPVCKFDEGCHRVVLCKPGCGALAAASPVPPHADQTALRDRIAEALYAHDHLGWRVSLRESDAEPVYRERAAAVLAFLPEQADRAAVLRSAADTVEAMNEGCGQSKPCASCDARTDAADALRDAARRVAAAEQPVSCAECGHPRTVHREGDDPVTPGECSACPDDDARHDYRPAVGEQPGLLPSRGDTVDTWLKTQRNEHRDDNHGQWSTLDQLLDLYRLHADTGTPLGQHVCEARTVGDCGCLEQPETQEAPNLPCSYWTFTRTEHTPHRWEPQPGMDPVHCPGYSRTPE